MKLLLRFVMWSIPVFFLAFASWQYYGLGGTLVMHRDFASVSPLVNDPVPSSRVTRRNAFPVIIDEPVYLDVRMPRHFDSVKVSLEYENPHAVPIKFGPKLQVGDDPHSWKFDLRTLDVLPLQFDIAPLEVQHHKLRFIVSAPQVRGAPQGIILKDMTVEFTGTSLWQKIYSLLPW